MKLKLMKSKLLAHAIVGILQVAFALVFVFSFVAIALSGLSHEEIMRGSIALSIMLYLVLFGLGIAFLVLSIILTIKANELGKEYETYFILYIVGIFVGIVGIVSSFILLSKIKEQETNDQVETVK